MASFSSNPKVQLATTAVVSAAVAAGAVLSYQRLQQGDRASRLKQSIPQSSEIEPALQSVFPPQHQYHHRKPAIQPTNSFCQWIR